MLKGKYCRGKGNIHFSVDEGCRLPLDYFSKQYELSPDSHVLAMIKCTVPVQNFLMCKFTFEMSFHFEKLVSCYIQ